jgi:DNA polymerase-1
MEIFIMSGDKDLLQLVSPQVKVINMHKRGEIYDCDKVREMWGVEPCRLIDVMALMGDSSDNVPGVPGIGRKGAVDLIQKFGSLERLLQRLDDVANVRQRKLLSTHSESAVMSRDLVTIKIGVPLPVNLEDCEVTGPDYARLLKLFEELEFKNLSRKLAQRRKVRREPNYVEVKTAAEVEELITEAKKAGAVAVAWAVGVLPHASSSLLKLSLAWRDGESRYLPLDWSGAVKGEQGELKLDGSGKEENTAGVSSLKKLSPLFENAGADKVGHGLKSLCALLAKEDMELKGNLYDVSVAAYLLDPVGGEKPLAEICRIYLGDELPPEGDPVAGRDADVIRRLCPVLMEELKKVSLYGLFKEIEMPLVSVLARMEHAGVCVSTDVLERMSRGIEERAKSLEEKIYRLAGGCFQISSSKQLSAILFEKLKLSPIKKTKTGFSTDREVLERLSLEHELPELVLGYRELIKLKNTYLDVLPSLIDEKDDCVHTSFNQCSTATGRLSSSGPNLQNIPIRTEVGKEIREAFIPRDPARLMMSADYSQIELRILAHLSEDEILIDAFEKDKDVHGITAAEVFGVAAEEVTDWMRRVGKVVNFGIVYGISSVGLARSVGVSLGEAQGFIKRYFERYRGVKEYIEKVINEAKKSGFVTTILKRRRYLPDINSKNRGKREFAERIAGNSPVQGAAADFIKLAMVRIDEKFRRDGLETKMVVQVHDELLFDVAKDELERAKEIVKKEMEEVYPLKVPLKVNVGVGKNWFEAH